MLEPGRKPRVAFLGYAHDARGGIAQFGRGLAERVGERADVALIGYRKLYPGFTRPGRQQPDPSAHHSPVTGPKITVPWLPWTWRATSEHIERFDADVLVVQWWNPILGPSLWSILRRARKHGIRTLVMCHNDRPHEPFPFWRPLTRWTLSQADALATFSEHVGDGLRAIVPGAQVQLVPLPQALVSPQPGGAPGDRGRPGAPVILFFGNVRAYKGLEDLVAAMPIVRHSVDATLVVAGTFMEPLERYQEQARRLGVDGHVRFIDAYVADEEVAQLFAGSDVVALPYRSATGSAVLGQAAVARKPVVATTVGSLPAALDGRGVLVPPRDPAALAEGLIRALEDPPPPPPLDEGSWDRCRDLVLEYAGSPS